MEPLILWNGQVSSDNKKEKEKKGKRAGFTRPA
jgi:hypothetical protein